MQPSPPNLTRVHGVASTWGAADAFSCAFPTSPPSPLSVNGEGEPCVRRAAVPPSPFTERGVRGVRLEKSGAHAARLSSDDVPLSAPPNPFLIRAHRLSLVRRRGQHFCPHPLPPLPRRGRGGTGSAAHALNSPLPRRGRGAGGEAKTADAPPTTVLSRLKPRLVLVVGGDADTTRQPERSVGVPADDFQPVAWASRRRFSTRSVGVPTDDFQPVASVSSPTIFNP